MSKTLTTKEAMQALLDGKKIRKVYLQKVWPCHYISLNRFGNIVGSDGSLSEICSIEDYELYEETKPKKKANYSIFFVDEPAEGLTEKSLKEISSTRFKMTEEQPVRKSRYENAVSESWFSLNRNEIINSFKKLASTTKRRKRIEKLKKELNFLLDKENESWETFREYCIKYKTINLEE